MNLEMFKREIEKLNIDCDEDKLRMLDDYYNLLISWNKKINLTAIVDKEDVYLKHFYDSLTIVKILDLNSISSLCDIGTGAGFPGIVLKIFFPHLNVTLIDSLGKRIKFLENVILVLGLENVTIINTRAEEYSKINREKYDVVTARAVSSFNILLEYSIPLIKVGKFFVAMRGMDDSVGSSNALKLLDSHIVDKKVFELPNKSGVRTLILIKKNKKTDVKYPRRFSEMKRKSL